MLLIDSKLPWLYFYKTPFKMIKPLKSANPEKGTYKKPLPRNIGAGKAAFHASKNKKIKPGNISVGILTPAIIDRFIRRIPKGKLATLDMINNRFASSFGAGKTSRVTIKILVMISAWAAENVIAIGKSEIAPYWRVLKKEGRLNRKFPGGVERQAVYLAAEGFRVTKTVREDSWRIKDFEKYLLDA